MKIVSQTRKRKDMALWARARGTYSTALGRGCIVATALILGACSSHPTPPPTDEGNHGGQGASDANARHGVEIDVPVDSDPALESVAKLITQAGGKIRAYKFPPDAAPPDPTAAVTAYPAEAERVYVELDLHNAKISDAQLAKLAEEPGFQKVTSIALGNSSINDNSLAYIAKASKLQYLDISGTKVTDQGLAQLMGHPSLGYIVFDTWADGHGISREAGDRLMRSLPALQR